MKQAVQSFLLISYLYCAMFLPIFVLKYFYPDLDDARKVFGPPDWPYYLGYLRSYFLMTISYLSVVLLAASPIFAVAFIKSEDKWNDVKANWRYLTFPLWGPLVALAVIPMALGYCSRHYWKTGHSLGNAL